MPETSVKSKRWRCILRSERPSTSSSITPQISHQEEEFLRRTSLPGGRFYPEFVESKDAGVVDSIPENEEYPPNSNGPNCSVVFQCAEYVEGLPIAPDLLSCLPEVLVLDGNHNPVVQSEVVLAKPILFGAKLNIPKAARITALACYALSVGYDDSSLHRGPNTFPTALSPSHGTAVAIDNFHLLTVAHNFGYDTSIRNYPTTNLKYRIIVRHDHKKHVDRYTMQTDPDASNIEVSVFAYADSHSTTSIRTANNDIVPLATDVVLLKAVKPLGLKEFPTPTKYHVPPNDIARTSTVQDIHMLSYNGNPSATELRDRYPNTPTDVLHEGVRDLWIDRLAYASGKTDTSSFDPDAIYHRISCLAGASGAPLINANGEMIGLHSRGEYRPNPAKPSDRIVLPSCKNVAVSLDAPQIQSFLKNVVAPQLSQDVRTRWLNL